ncbi:hypothetical protein [Salinibacter ruber]|uniref:hypothetical protein n=1 Tax=Salinibacter ruber TaxID=146919 RepID=UPI002167D7CD|nr:hypothetical protein [Salinibacter ruber]
MAVDICFLTIGTFSENAMMKRVKGLAPDLLDAGHRVTVVAQDTAENREYFSGVEAEKASFPSTGVLREIRLKARILLDRGSDSGLLLVFEPQVGAVLIDKNAGFLRGSPVTIGRMVSSFVSRHTRKQAQPVLRPTIPTTGGRSGLLPECDDGASAPMGRPSARCD